MSKYYLTAIRDIKLTDIEQIDLTGSGANLLTLDDGEVINLSTTSNRVVVTGETGDAVDAGSGWTNDGVDPTLGAGFTAYSQGAAELVVNDAVDQSLITL